MDLNHTYGSDLSVTPAGDIAISSITQSGLQRVYRRLLTNPILKDGAGNVIATGDYLAQQGYGAGLGRLVGSPQDVQTTRALIQSQMQLEDAVSQNPPPVVSLSPMFDGLSVQITYTDANTSTPQFVAFDINK